ncbi:MAG: thiol reductant ABC exporter subunit CydC [Ktedonobacterales bacterium]
MMTYVRLLKLILPFRWRVAISILLGFATIGASVGLMAMSAYLISRAAQVSSVADLSVAIAAVQLFAISRAALRYMERYVTHATTFRILARLRAWVYACLEPLAPARLSERRSGDVLTRLTADIDTLEHFYARSVVPPAVGALVTAMSCVILGLFNLWLGLALLLFLVLTGVALPLLVQRLGQAPAAELVATRAELNATLVDEIQGIADLMAFSQESRHRKRVLALNRQLNHIQERMAVIRGMGTALGTLFAGLAGLTVLCLAIPLVSEGRISGVFLALLPLTAIASFEAVQPLPTAWQNLEASGSAARRLFELIDLEPGQTGAPLPLPDSAPRPQLSSADCSLVVQHLRFAYADGEAPVLCDVSFTVPDHGRQVIVGPSGAGKSTLVSILLRFWEYQAGSIKLGGRELRDYHPDDVRALISIVAQDTYLFSGTLRDNLLLASPEAGDDQIIAACRRAELHGFIQSLPRGYDTWIGENGFLLSGGERQRLAIARAILKDAPILLLDEATAHLDSVTEAAVWRALMQLMDGRTTLVFAHRIPGLLPADKVLTLDQGRMVVPEIA